jgi:hypothetical protein
MILMKSPTISGLWRSRRRRPKSYLFELCMFFMNKVMLCFRSDSDEKPDNF